MWRVLKTGFLTEKVRIDLILLRRQNTWENEGVWRYIKNLCGSLAKRELTVVNLLLFNYCYSVLLQCCLCWLYRAVYYMHFPRKKYLYTDEAEIATDSTPLVGSCVALLSSMPNSTILRESLRRVDFSTQCYFQCTFEMFTVLSGYVSLLINDISEWNF